MIFRFKNLLVGILLPTFLLPTAFVLASDSSSHGYPHALLYVTSSKSSLDSLRAHATSVDIIAPQTYAAKADGTLLGTMNPAIIQIAQNSGAQLMPLVVNQNFNQKAMHKILTNDAAQNKLLTALVAEGKEQKYLGFQYDFEHMAASDKDLYSAFVAKSAGIFHAVGLQFSVAVAPKHSDLAEDYGEGSWQNWTGAFDYSAIGASADFISVMAYDDSKSVGPVASYPWVQSVLAYTLEKVPANKVSLGLAFYGWARSNTTGKIDHIVTYPNVAALSSNPKASIVTQGWSTELGTSYLIYKKNKRSYTVWYEDSRSFNQKLTLVTDKQLRGFSAWAIGQEDPAIWSTLVAMRTPNTMGDLAFQQ